MQQEDRQRYSQLINDIGKTRAEYETQKAQGDMVGFFVRDSCHACHGLIDDLINQNSELHLGLRELGLRHATVDSSRYPGFAYEERGDGPIAFALPLIILYRAGKNVAHRTGYGSAGQLIMRLRSW